MGILSWIVGDSKDIVVTTLKSKGPGRPITPITKADIEKKRFTDKNGFVNLQQKYLREDSGRLAWCISKIWC